MLTSLNSPASQLIAARIALAALAVGAAAVAMPLPLDSVIGLAVVTGAAMFLLGVVARRGAEQAAESALIARVVRRAASEPGVRALLHTAFDELGSLLKSDSMFIAARDGRRGRSQVWHLRRTSGDPEMRLLQTEKGSEAWLLAVDNGTVTRRDAVLPAAVTPDAAIMKCSPRSIVALTLALWDRWDAAVLVLDPKTPPSSEGLRLARLVLNELQIPALNAFELTRLRGRVTSGVRTRLARDLHDGLLQSLIGLELKTAALRERTAQRDPDAAAGLGQLQRALRTETAEARRLMEHLKAKAVEPHELVEAMSASLMKFQHDTGVKTTFAADEQYGTLSPRVSGELARILQEALANVRRHSRARCVTVRLAQQNGACHLTIEDDGAGFPFAGRRTLDELAKSRSGPATIMERVRLLGGQLFVDSAPTRGAKIEIVVPPGRS
jgi:signal transduction histidine kinase